MNPNFKEYLDLLVPKNLPQKRRNELFNELETHLFDKARYYEEIGYSKDESLDLAVRDMGTDEKTIKEINGEFESLYRERTWQAPAAGAAVLLLNLLCAYSGNFVLSADYLGDPDFLMNCVSFGIIFVVLFIIVISKELKLRKTLIAVGTANLLIAASVLLCVFPQAALFSIETNLAFLVDRFTPISAWNGEYYGAAAFYFYFSYAFAVICAVCCFILARKIRTGRTEKNGSPKKRVFAFCGVFLFVAVFTCCLYPTAYSHIKNIPQYVYPDNSYVSKNAASVYSQLEKTDSYEESRKILSANNMVNTDEFKKTLTYSQKKALSKQLGQLKLEDKSFEIWFSKDTSEDGNGLIFLKKGEDDRLAARGIGNGSKFLEEWKYGKYNFYFFNAKSCEGKKCVEYFRTLKNGSDEKSVIAFFKSNNACFYSDFSFFENGGERRVYRMYQQQQDGEKFTELNIELYTELVFENGKLSSGSMLENSEQWFSSANVVRTSNTFKIEQ